MRVVLDLGFKPHAQCDLGIQGFGALKVQGFCGRGSVGSPIHPDFVA